MIETETNSCSLYIFHVQKLYNFYNKVFMEFDVILIKFCLFSKVFYSEVCYRRVLVAFIDNVCSKTKCGMWNHWEINKSSYLLLPSSHFALFI
jgi:hypothetical protein